MNKESTLKEGCAVKKPKLSFKILPNSFNDCKAEDLISLLVEMFNKLIHHNDTIPTTLANTTRFHSRSAPNISIKDYVERINKYVIVEKSVLLMILVYVDRMCSLYPTFTINSLTAHRFLIAAVTASCKCVSDVYSTNAFFAKVGGISTQELNAIELEFCKLLGWRLQCSASLLQQYYINLVNTNPNFQLQESSTAILPPLSPQSPIDPYLDHSSIS